MFWGTCYCQHWHFDWQLMSQICYFSIVDMHKQILTFLHCYRSLKAML